MDTPILLGDDRGEDRHNLISWEEYSVWLGDFMAQSPLLFLVCSLWGVSGIAHAVFLTGAPGSLMAADVDWLRGITDHGLHLSLVGCKVWAAALCFYLNARFERIGSTSIVFLVSALLTLVPPVLAVVVAYNANWQLVMTMLVSVGVYVWCEIMPLLAVQLFPTSHRVAGSALGLAMSKACSILSYYQVLSWEETSLVLPYMGVALCGLLGTLISVAAPDPPVSIDVPITDAGLLTHWMQWKVYKGNALARIRYIYYDYCAQFTGYHTGMLLCAVASSSVGGFAISKVLAFLLPEIRHDLHMPRTTMSLLYSLAVAIAALAQPELGALVDQYGYGQGLSGIMLCFSCAVLLPMLAYIVRFDTFFNMGLAGAVLIMGLALLTLLALSKTSQTASVSLVNRWFTRQRGQAMSFYTIGFWAVSDLVLVQIVQACGWKISMYIAAASGLVGSILARVYIVDTPDEVGLTPDIGMAGPVLWTTVSHPQVHSPGATPPPTPPGGLSREGSGREFKSPLAPLSPHARRPTAGEQKSFTLKQASQTWAFHLITLFMIMYGVFGSSTALLLVDIITDGDKQVSPLAGQIPDKSYQVPDPHMFDDSGSGEMPKGANGIGGYSDYEYSLDVATYYYGPHFLMSVMTTLVTGQLIDGGVHERWLLFVSGGTLAAGLVVLPHVKDATSAILCGTLRGVSYGLNDPVRYSIMGKYFGPDHLAEIIGSTQRPYLLGLGAGPLIITVCRDWDGSGYTVTLNFFAFCTMVVTTAILFLQKPPLPDRAREEEREDT